MKSLIQQHLTTGTLLLSDQAAAPAPDLSQEPGRMCRATWGPKGPKASESALCAWGGALRNSEPHGGEGGAGRGAGQAWTCPPADNSLSPAGPYIQIRRPPSLHQHFPALASGAADPVTTDCPGHLPLDVLLSCLRGQEMPYICAIDVVTTSPSGS